MAPDQRDGWNGHRRWESPPIDMPFDRLHTASRRPWWLLDAVRTAQRAAPPERADALAEIDLQDQDGRATRLGDLWADRPAVIVWLRQFGCPFCRSYAIRLNRSRSRFEEAGGRLILIGQGTPAQAARFRGRFHIDLPVLADPERTSYLRVGTKLATLGELIGPAVVAKSVVAMARTGVFLGHNTADEAQLGGSVIVDTDGAIRFAHISEDASDMASPAAVLAALRLVTAPRLAGTAQTHANAPA